jgi:enoyl-CoA hydratase/carnithine racemase
MERITINVKNGVANVQMNYPKNLNALNEPMLNELMESIDQCQADSAVKVVVLSGAGKGFSAGGDIAEMIQGIQSKAVDFTGTMEKLKETALKVRRCTKPVIASMHGPVAGAGFSLALLCDFRIAADNAKFIEAFVNIGLVPDMGSVYSLAKIVGLGTMTELVMTGKALDAKRALELNLLNQVVPFEDLEATTEKFAMYIASRPAIALANMKAMINNLYYEDFEKALDQETKYQLQCSETADFVEGIMAFAQKRKPVFVGK